MDSLLKKFKTYTINGKNNYVDSLELRKIIKTLPKKQIFQC